MASKRRSCDQCRNRKLACSKDEDGCLRCKRENITCHYSEQKPMGRPRKRQFIEAAHQPPVNSGQGHETMEDVDVSIFDNNPMLANDDAAVLYFTNIVPQAGIDASITAPTIGQPVSPEQGRWNFAYSRALAGPAIDFSDTMVEHIPEPTSGEMLQLFERPMTTDDAKKEPLRFFSDGPCSCLASMYLALSSLQQFPDDIVSALRVVRSAAATAASSIWCPKCGSILLESPNPPIDAFQNTMLLGTILPVIANGYEKLLSMVDREADAALLAGETKTYRFADYGGLKASNGSVEQLFPCVDGEILSSAVEMRPELWRTSVRALLRVDIYGHEVGTCRHRGLKDLVTEMENRQKSRHHMIDAQVASGAIVLTEYGHGELGRRLCVGEQNHGCLQILTMAKMAIDNLVIA